MRNTKIKTSGMTSILKSLDYKTNVVVNHIHRGYKTILTAMRDDAIVEMHLTLKESLFNDESEIKVRFYDIKKDKEVFVEKTFINSDRESTAKNIIRAFEEANNENKLFIESVLKMFYISIVDTKTIKELYSAYKIINKLHKKIDENAKW